ncbi:ABC transporter substrate-binding protein [Paenibacillus periandrae]|uniref:ABC transporter substrate-binding protein n=1 Tax=Paenibacillus periandrae TaxID=1761741 RepID=UPI001F09E0F3
MKRWLVGLLLIAVMLVGTVGCELSVSSKDKGNTTRFKALGKDAKAKIKVLFYNEQAFAMLYRNTFNAKYPNIEVEVIPMTSLMLPGKDKNKELVKLLEETSPDVMFLSQEQYEKLSGDGKLLELETIIKKDKFDLDSMLPASTQLLKTKGNGMLYGLASGFSAKALYYNKDIFDQNGVPYPTDRMSWDEVLQLAKRFPTNGEGPNRIYGFHQGSFQSGYYELLNNMGHTQGLSMVDSESMTVKINSEPWKKIVQLAVDAYRAGAIAEPSNPAANMNAVDSIFTQNHFITGKAAMTVDNFNMIAMMSEAQKTVKDLKPVNWALVTEPIDRSNPDTATSFALSQIMAINSKTTDPAAAWELVKYLNGDEYAKIISKSTFELLTRTAYVKDKDGRSLEAFYKLRPGDKSYNDFNTLTVIPFSFYTAFDTIVNQEFKSVLDQKKTIEDALKEIEDKGQQEMTKAKLEQESGKDSKQ